MRDMLRTVLRAISAAWAKRQHDALRDKIEDKMVADLEAIVTNMKRAREHVERGGNEIRRTASDDATSFAPRPRRVGTAYRSALERYRKLFSDQDRANVAAVRFQRAAAAPSRRAFRCGATTSPLGGTT